MFGVSTLVRFSLNALPNIDTTILHCGVAFSVYKDIDCILTKEHRNVNYS